MRFIAQCYEEKGNMKEARSWLFRALAECPDAREPYLALVKSAYKEKKLAPVLRHGRKRIIDQGKFRQLSGRTGMLGICFV